MDASARLPLLAGCLLAATGIIFGAFGVHGLKAILSTDVLGWWRTGVQYQMWNAVGLVALGAARVDGMRMPSALLIFGTILFSGTLYLMALTGMLWLGAVTPLGGLGMILGWALAAWRLAKMRSLP